MSSPEPRPLMTAQQLCEYLSVTLDWLYEQIGHQRIPFIKIGQRSYRFRPEDIEAWLAERSAATTEES